MYHFDLNYAVVRMRQDELVDRATRGRTSADTTRGRRWFRRRRGAAEAPAAPPPPEPRRLVVVSPPRHDRDPSGRDTRVA
jgi:hypothetical protein